MFRIKIKLIYLQSNEFVISSTICQESLFEFDRSEWFLKVQRPMFIFTDSYSYSKTNPLDMFMYFHLSVADNIHTITDSWWRPDMQNQRAERRDKLIEIIRNSGQREKEREEKAVDDERRTFS